jgi:hypothetical protein
MFRYCVVAPSFCRHMPGITDVLKDIGQGHNLSNLVTALTDIEM